MPVYRIESSAKRRTKKDIKKIIVLLEKIKFLDFINKKQLNKEIIGI